MRQFIHTHSLYYLPWASKLATGWFLVLTLAGYGLTLALTARTSGFTVEETTTHYRGDGGDVYYPKSTHELLESAHFHAFSMPVIFLVVGHLAGLTRYPRAVKTVLISAGGLGVGLGLAAPFLVVRAVPFSAALKLGANLLMGVSLPVMCLLALADLILPPRRSSH